MSTDNTHTPQYVQSTAPPSSSSTDNQPRVISPPPRPNALQSIALARLDAASIEASRSRVALLCSQAELIKKRLDDAPSLSAPADSLAKAVSSLPPLLDSLPLPPPPSLAPTRLRYLRLCHALAQALPVVDDPTTFASLMRSCESLPPLLLRDRLLQVLVQRRPALIVRANEALNEALSSLQWPHACLARELFPPSDSLAAAAAVSTSLTALIDLASATAAAGALASALTPRLIYLSASLGPSTALPPLLAALQSLLRILPNSDKITELLWPHLIIALLAPLSNRYARIESTTTSAEGNNANDVLREEATEDEMASEIDEISQLLYDKYQYPPLIGSFPSVLSLLARRSSLVRAWGSRVERASQDRLADSIDGADMWRPMPFCDQVFPALPAAAQALPPLLAPLFRRLPPGATAAHCLLIRGIASRLVARFLTTLRAAAVRASTSTSNAPSSLYAIRCAPLNAAVYVRDSLASMPLQSSFFPANMQAVDEETLENVRRTMKECVTQIAAQATRGISEGGTELMTEEEICGSFAINVAVYMPLIPTVVQARFMKICIGQLQAVLMEKFSQFLSKSPKEDMAARLRSIHSLALSVLSSYPTISTTAASLLRPLSTLLRIAEGLTVSDDAVQRLPESLVASLVAWKDSLSSN